jgi:hypothetical protein
MVAEIKHSALNSADVFLDRDILHIKNGGSFS